jgi:rubrerythrin
MFSPMAPLHRWIWRNPRRRALNLLRFADVEADGGRDLVRAAELTADPVLRRSFLIHAADEQRHADLFRQRGLELLRTTAARPGESASAEWMAPGERGLDDLRVESEQEGALLAFLHLSEKAAAREFAAYAQALSGDPQTRAVFQAVMRDETFHMKYTDGQLRRLAPDPAALLWRARLSRLWKAYLRLAGGLAEMIASVILTLQFYLLLPAFALAAKRQARRTPDGWRVIAADRNGRLDRQY